MFELHHQLAKDCIDLGELGLCRLLLMNDGNYPWFILVPQVAGITEIYQLGADDQVRLVRESSRFSAWLQQAFAADKINVAALGNVVPQLHVHHIARYRDDPAWPGPVWGKVPAVPYPEDQLAALRARVREFLD